MAARAYSFRIAPEAKAAAALRTTHVAVNAGANVFLDWLMNFRGGLSALRGTDVGSKILLTRSWLTVESIVGAPEAFVVPHTVADGKSLWHTRDAIEEILRADGLDAAERETWHADVSGAIGAAVRDDAVWVNRRAAFNALCERVGAISQADINDLLFDCGLLDESRYFALDVVPEPPDLVKGTAQFLSLRFGTGKGTDFAALALAYDCVAATVATLSAGVKPDHIITQIARGLRAPEDATLGARADFILKCLSGPGHKSATRNALKRLFSGEYDDLVTLVEKLRAAAPEDAENCRAKLGSRAKGNRPWSDALEADVARASGFSYQPKAGGTARHRQFVVMMDQAARRVSGIHSFTRNAEVLRRSLDLAALEAAVAPPVQRFLDAFAQDRAIRLRGIGGWQDVCDAWDGCTTVAERMEALKSVQRGYVTDREHFGDVALFTAIASDEGAPVREQPESLGAYVELADARRKVAAWKAPMLRHIDPWLSPVWVEYGNGRWPISYTPNDEGATITLELLNKTESLGSHSVRAYGKRFAADLGVSDPMGTPVVRANRLGRIASGVNLDAPVRVTALEDAGDWNGKLHFDRDFTGEGEPKRIDWTLTYSASLQPRDLPDGLRAHLRANRDANKKRGRSAELNLGRRPGVRLLGVDLGIRAAAACAVLETTSSDDVLAVCKRQKVRAPQAEDLYLTIPRPGARPLHYRRIAGDTLPDGTTHPAPWARVERTFVIQLPGEERDARKGSPEEIALVQRVAADFHAEPPLKRGVDVLQAYAVSILRRALGRHKRLGALLYRLHLFEAGDIDAAKAIAALEQLAKLTSRTGGEANAKLAARIDDLLALGEALTPAAVDDIRKHLTGVWTENDTRIQKTIGTLRSWLIPRKGTAGERQHVGGASHRRLDTLIGFRRAQVSFAMRPFPTIAPEPGRVRFGYAEKMRVAVEKLREERVRLLASRILEAAVGGSRSSLGERAVERAFEPCEAIIIESLAHYRPRQDRSRRENSTLMTWSAARLLTWLRDGCALHGIYLREVPAGYTSLLDGYTGAPGVLCDDVSVASFVRAPWWRERIETALKKRARKTETATDELLLAWWDRWDVESNTWTDEGGVRWRLQGRGWAPQSRAKTQPRPLLLPSHGGDLFVSVAGARARNADCNSAVAIGALAVLDPDWAGTWTFVPAKAGSPLSERVKGSAVWDRTTELAIDGDEGDRVINAWRDASTSLPTQSEWMTYKIHRRSVEERVTALLLARLQETLRLTA
jgi:IS605 OrfB family transposase